MSKKNVNEVAQDQNVEVQGEVAENEALSEEEKLAKFKENKRAAAKRFKEKRAAEKAERIENAKRFIEEVKADGRWDTYSEQNKAFLISLTVESVGGSNEPVFKKIFGENPQVGDTVTLFTAMQKSLKGKNNIDHLIKKWAENGTVVSYTANKENVLESVYKIEALPSA